MILQWVPFKEVASLHLLVSHGDADRAEEQRAEIMGCSHKPVLDGSVRKDSSHSRQQAPYPRLGNLGREQAVQMNEGQHAIPFQKTYYGHFQTYTKITE